MMIFGGHCLILTRKLPLLNEDQNHHCSTMTKNNVHHYITTKKDPHCGMVIESHHHHLI
jgi:hypothetical protein